MDAPCGAAPTRGALQQCDQAVGLLCLRLARCLLHQMLLREQPARAHVHPRERAPVYVHTHARNPDCASAVTNEDMYQNRYCNARLTPLLN
jgi:hypothetical protein